MSLTPKERQQKIEEREKHILQIETSESIIAHNKERIGQLDRELAEPEDWVPGEASWFEYIKVDGAIDKAYTGLGVNPRTIAFNNFFQPGTGQAEAVAPVAGAWLKIYKTAFTLGISGERLMDAINRHYNHNGLWSEDTNELLRLCPSEINTVRKWNTK